MKNKKIVMYICIIIIIIIILVVGYYIFNNSQKRYNKNNGEYIPQEEISEEQMRKTVVLLYFLDPKNYALIPEARQIDSKELIDYPYEFLINLLIEGPKNEKLIKLIPEGAKLINTKIENNILYLNFSEELIKNQNLGKEQEGLILKSIVNTVTELTEINEIAILIEGEKDKGFPDDGIIFNKVFIRE